MPRPIRCAAPRRSSTWRTGWATASDSRCTIRPHPWYGTGTFAEGDVFTIEPGIYISTRLLDILPDTPKNRAMIAKVRPAVERYQNIGIRIEDDYVDHRDRRRVAVPRAARDRGGRGRDGQSARGPRQAAERSIHGDRHAFVTTPTIEGRRVTRYLGIVTGEAILGANIFRDFFAGIRDIVGGRSAAYEEELRKAKAIALEEMEARPRSSAPTRSSRWTSTTRPSRWEPAAGC